MNIIRFPNRNRLFSDFERLAIVRYTAYIPEANLEFNYIGAYDTAIISFDGKEWCILRQGSEVMVASINSNEPDKINAEISIEFMSSSVEDALVKLMDYFRVLAGK